MPDIDIQFIFDLFAQYGLIYLFAVVFLEYMNMPGLPAGIIMPATGILIAEGNVPFWQAIIISVIAGLLGSLVLYGVGYLFGKRLLDWTYKKFPKSRKSIDKTYAYLDRHGDSCSFYTRLMPVARTLISIVLGSARVKPLRFIIYSTGGIAIWNIVTIYAGYAFGHYFL